MTEQNKIHIQELELQHEYLFSLMLKLEKSIINNQANEAIAGILEELEKYTQYHFVAENNYAKQFGAQLTDQHQDEHKQFTVMVNEIKQTMDESHLKSSLVMLDFLRNWLREHIKKTDEQCWQDVQQKARG